MKTITTNKIAVAVIAIIVALVAMSGYAYTASNTVPATTAGIGTSTTSGYAVSNVQYQLNATDPSKTSGVTFTIAPATVATVKARLVSTGTWSNCTHNAGAVTCAVAVNVADADQLSVVATQ